VRGTHLTAIVFIVVAGCSFAGSTEMGDDPPPDPGEPPPPPGSDPVPPPPPGVERKCSEGDQVNMKACFDFEDPAPFQRAYDGYPMGEAADVEMMNVNIMMRAPNNQAAEIQANSSLRIPELAKLDIADELTVEMWIRPSQSPSSTVALLDNDRQFSISLRSDRRIECDLRVDGTSTPSATSTTTVSTSSWTHVACSYDGSRLRAYVRGDVEDCASFSETIATDSTVGIAIGADLQSNGTLGVRYIGGVDQIRIYARARDGGALCDAAGESDCRSSCPEPDGGGSGPGGGGPGGGGGGGGGGGD
jgi:hypothetical protein